MQMLRMWGAALILVSRALAQDPFLTRWHTLQTHQPDAVKLIVSTPKSSFFQGEVISLQLAFTSTEPKAFQAGTRLYDRAGRMNYTEEFVVDPAASVEDPLAGLPGADMSMGGLSGGPQILSMKPFTFERILNEWVRFRQPGTYRLYVVSRRVSRIPPSAAVELVSNAVTLEIRPAPPEWIAEQIADAGKVLETRLAETDAELKARIAAVRTLRFLDTPQAAIELAKRLNEDSNIGYWGLIDTRYRPQVIAVLEKRLTAADQSTGVQLLKILAELAVLQDSGGPIGPYPLRESERQAWQDESKRRLDLDQKKWKEYAGRLIASLPSKETQARAEGLNMLLNLSAFLDLQPDWLTAIVSSLRTDFTRLPPRTQQNLLEQRWPLITSPAMLSILRDVYANPPEARLDPSLQDTALRRIYDLAPDEGRRLILDVIRRTDSHIRFETLAMLPDRTLPDLDPLFATRAERGQDSRLILRYATGSIVKEVEAAYLRHNQELDRQKLPHCVDPLIYYFLQHDPEFGERELRRNMATPGGYPACYDIGFQFLGLGRRAMSPALERLAIEFLSSPSVPVKKGAAEVLGKYGSPAAQEPLWHTMEFFRSWWKGREPQLKDPSGEEGLQLEHALRVALAQADAWSLGEEELKRLLTLCSSDWCQQDMSQWLSQAANPIRVSGTPGLRFSVGQYELASEAELRQKLAQYPPSATFKVEGEDRQAGMKQAREIAGEAVRDSGHALVQ